MGISGVAYYDSKWITPNNIDNFGTKWVLSISGPDFYRGNTIEFTTDPWETGTFTVSSNFGINIGPFPSGGNQLSDFSCAEILFIDRKLNESEIECIEDYLDDKYKLFAQTSPGECLSNKKKLVGWYTSESFDSVTNKWMDITERGFNNDIEITDSTGLGSLTEIDTSNELYLNGKQAIYGSTGNLFARAMFHIIFACTIYIII